VLASGILPTFSEYADTDHLSTQDPHILWVPLIDGIISFWPVFAEDMPESRDMPRFEDMRSEDITSQDMTKLRREHLVLLSIATYNSIVT